MDKVGYSISRQPSREENFAFPYNSVLHIGLNMVAGFVDDVAAWTARIDDNLNWIEQNVQTYKDQVEIVVIYGHTGMIYEYRDFFLSLRKSIIQWNSEIVDIVSGRTRNLSVLYVKESSNIWSLKRQYLGVEQFMLLNVQATKWPPMRVYIDPNKDELRLEQNDWFEDLVGINTDNVKGENDKYRKKAS